jgi:hypothetical protein
MPDPIKRLQSAPVYKTAADERESAAAIEASRPGVLGSVGAAINSEWVSSWAFRQMGGAMIEPDPNFELTEAKLTRFGEGLPTSMLNGFQEAVSDDDMMRIRENLLGVAESRRKLADLGWTGTALTIAANVLDPTAIAAGLLSGGVGVTSKAGRLAAMVRGGLATGAEAAATEAYLATQDPERGLKDVLFAGAGAMVLGGAVGAWRGSGLSKAARRVQDAVHEDDIVGTGLSFTPKYRRPPIDRTRTLTAYADLEEVEWRYVDDVPPSAGPSAGSPVPPKEPPVQGMGAASPSTITPGVAAKTKKPTDFHINDVPDYNVAPRSGGVARIDMVGQLKRSESGMTRTVADMLAEDGALSRDGGVTRQSASEWKSVEGARRISKFYRESLPAFGEYLKARGVQFYNIPKKLKLRDQFFEDVGRAVRMPRGQYTTDPHINKVADGLRQQHKDLLALAQRHGVKGFENIPENDQYLMRVFNQSAISRAISQHGHDNVRRLIQNSIVDTSGTLTPQKAAKLADGYLRAIQDLAYGTNIEKATMFDEGDLEMLRRTLANKGLSADDIDDIVFTMKPKGDGSNLVDRAKRRFEVDENAKITTPKGELRFTDLLENNAETLFNVYTHEIVGASAVSEILRAVARTPAELAESTGGLLRRLESEYKSLGIAPSIAREELSKLNTLIKSIKGESLGGHGKVAMAAKFARQYNYLRSGGQFGFAQVAELGNVIAANGLRGMIQDIPALRTFFARAADGKLTNEALAWIEDITADGTDRMVHQALARFDYGEVGAEAIAGNLTRNMQRASRAVSDLSGLASINTVLQRWAGLAVLRRWMTMAGSGKLPSKKRLASFGLEEGMASRIMDQIRQFDTPERGILGYRAKRMRIEQWTDQEAAAALVAATSKWTRQIILRSDVGAMSQWMTTDLGRIIIQFRSFAVQAYTKALQRNLQIRDLEAWTALALPPVLGALAYAGKTYIDSIGRDDAEKYRKKNLSVDRIITAGVQRGGATGVMTPFTDSIMSWYGFDPLFGHARTSGMPANVLLGNPTADTINTLTNVGLGARAIFDDDRDLTGRNVRDLASLIPFQNVTGVKNVIDAITTRMPKKP